MFTLMELALFREWYRTIKLLKCNTSYDDILNEKLNNIYIREIIKDEIEKEG